MLCERIQRMVYWNLLSAMPHQLCNAWMPYSMTASMFLPRNRREGIFLVLILMLAGFFLYRIAQFKSFGPASNHITAVLSTTRGEHDSVVTEVFIDSSEDRFQRSRR